MALWWRAYNEALHDPKVQNLPGEAFKFWFNILCVASKYDGEMPSKTDLRSLLGMRLDHLETYLKKLISAGLIDEVDGKLVPHNWQKRQYKSDCSTPRVQAHREAKRNVSETPPENRVQNTESSSLRSEGAREPAPKAIEKKPRRKPQTRLAETETLTPARIEAAGKVGLSEAQARREWERFRNHAQQTDRVCADWDAAWRNWCLKAAEILGTSRDGPVLPLAAPEVNWRERASMYQRMQIWPMTWGPEPGYGGCRCPPDILREFGLIAAATG